MRPTRKLSNKPQDIDKGNWYYEEPCGIDVVHEVYDTGEYIRTDHILIPWRKLAVTMKRYEAVAPKKKATR